MSHAEYCSKLVPAGGRILDIGAGRGRFLKEMAGLGFEIHGVETNSDYIGGNVIGTRAEELPFEDASFDFVNCAEVSEHVDDPIKVLKEIFRVLKPGGKCYISFHNRWSVYDYHYHLYFINWMPRVLAEPILKFLGRQKEDGPAGRQKLMTMHYYTYGHALKLLCDAGFTALDIRQERIKKFFGIFNFIFLILYFVVLRTFYFNTFHFLLLK